MKTTMVLDDAVFREAKAAAALRGQALGKFVEESIRRTLQERNGTTKAASSWIDGLPRVPAKAASELQRVVRAADFRSIDRSMWE